MGHRRAYVHGVVTGTECRRRRVRPQIRGHQPASGVPHLNVNVRITLLGRVPGLADMANHTRRVDSVSSLHQVLGLQMAVETPGMIGVFDDDHESDPLILTLGIFPLHIDHLSRSDRMDRCPQRSSQIRSPMKPATIPIPTKSSIALVHFRFSDVHLDRT